MAIFNKAAKPQRHMTAGAKLIYDAETIVAARSIPKVESDGGAMTQREADVLTKEELEFATGVDTVLTQTNSEAKLFRGLQPAPVHILRHPVGVARETPDFASRTGFLLVGRRLEKDSFDNEGMNWFIESVWAKMRAELHEVILTAVGDLNPEVVDLAAHGIRFLGETEILQELYAQARALVAPIRVADRMPIKILEAAAAGLPVIGTSLAADLLGWQPGVEIEVADNPAEMVTAAVRLYRDATRWEAVRSAPAAAD
jgi:glycosyltransferase involved in cell wall biosynthesis